MSGHSKWSTIKRAKGIKDAKRGSVFTKIGKLITIAARDKGGDLDTNFSLRLAVDKAKSVNMPKDNIEKAIKKGTGELEGGQIEELIYEGIGPANSQFVLKVLTEQEAKTLNALLDKIR
jgi:transcriptional/translational regulatory protein YebC/TACO1